MKFYTSYFYRIRFFTHNMVPVSTAMWDPDWYKRVKPSVEKGIIIGLNDKDFHFPLEQFNQMEHQCGHNCPYQDKLPCEFMIKYKQYLDSLDFNQVMQRFIDAERILTADGVIDGEPTFVLMVHEPYSCKCAERPVIQQYFQEHGIDIQEWIPPETPKKKVSLISKLNSVNTI